jgi:hypothetical protein
MNKTYDGQQAVAPGQPEQPAQEQEGQEEINFEEFLTSLPEEFRGEIEEALVSLLNYIHSDEGTSTILNDVQSAQGNEAAQVGISALQAMDAADGEHGWSDSAKVFAGYFAVSEITLLAREAGIIDIPKEQEDKIFKKAAENYLHGLITSKPTQEEREAEAIRIQKEVEPLIKETEKARQKQSGEGQPAAEEGLLE